MNQSQARVLDPILSSVVQGYRHAQHIHSALFPRVYTPVAAGQIIEFNKDSFRLYNTKRAPGTATKRITFGYEGKPYACVNHALDAVVSRENQREAQAVPGIDLASGSVNMNMRVDSLILENEAAGIARNAANYGVNNKLALAGTDQWSDYDNSDPEKDVETAREAVRSQIGMYPNTMEIPAKVWNALKRHPKIRAQMSNDSIKTVTTAYLQQLFDIDKIVIGKAIAFDDTDGAIDIWGTDVVLAYIPGVGSEGEEATYTREEPSFGYTYTVVGHPMVEQPWWDQSCKSWIYGISHERAPQLTSMNAGFLIKDAV